MRLPRRPSFFLQTRLNPKTRVHRFQFVRFNEFINVDLMCKDLTSTAGLFFTQGVPSPELGEPRSGPGSGCPGHVPTTFVT